MTSEAGGEEPDDDNLFADYNQNNKPKANRNDDLFGIDDEPKGNRFEDLGIFQDNPSRPKRKINRLCDVIKNFIADSNLRAQQEKAGITHFVYLFNSLFSRRWTGLSSAERRNRLRKGNWKTTV